MNEKREKYTAVVLAAGKGTRMGTSVAKQFLAIGEKPVVVYALEAFEQFDQIDQIILVTGEDKIEYCQKEIIEKYKISKNVLVCAGGRERYESVWKALQALKKLEQGAEKKTDYILIHDGARPFLNKEMLERLCASVEKEKACVLGMPVKDTIKITDENGKIKESPRRDLVWQAQTPQAFAAELLFSAFEKLMQHSTEGITDDAMVVEQEMGIASVMVKGGYENIKITTPEDLLVAESFLAEK